MTDFSERLRVVIRRPDLSCRLCGEGVVIVRDGGGYSIGHLCRSAGSGFMVVDQETEVGAVVAWKDLVGG